MIDWLTDWLIDWMIDWLNDWLIDWLIDWLNYWLTYLGCVLGRGQRSGHCERRLSWYGRWFWDDWTATWENVMTVTDRTDRRTAMTTDSRWERLRTSCYTAGCLVETSWRTSTVNTVTRTSFNVKQPRGHSKFTLHFFRWWHPSSLCHTVPHLQLTPPPIKIVTPSQPPTPPERKHLQISSNTEKVSVIVSVVVNVKEWSQVK